MYTFEADLIIIRDRLYVYASNIIVVWKQISRQTFLIFSYVIAFLQMINFASSLNDIIVSRINLQTRAKLRSKVNVLFITKEEIQYVQNGARAAGVRSKL